MSAEIQTTLVRITAISGAIAEGVLRENVFLRIVDSVQDLGYDRVRLDVVSQDGASVVPVAQRGFLGGPVPTKEDADLVQLRKDACPQIFDSGQKRGCVPILLRGEVAGKLVVEKKKGPLALERLNEIAPFAHLAALVLLRDEKRSWADSLESLQRTTLAITSVRDRDELLKAIVEQSVKLLGAKSGGLYEYRPEQGELTIIADFNREEPLLGSTLRIGEGMAGQLIASGKRFMTEPDYQAWAGRAEIYGGKRKFGAVLEVPLVWEGNVIGVLYVDDEAGRTFSETEARLLGLFADQAAICLTHSALLAKDVQKLQRLERLAQVTQEMMGNLDVMSWRTRLETIARSAAEVLEAETVGVFRVQGSELVLEASFGQEGPFEPGKKRLRIHDEDHGGLTGWIACQGELFNQHGEALKNHRAVAVGSVPHAPSGECYSLLAIPLKRKVGAKEEVIGLIRADNKQGQTLATFSEEDEKILTIFAEAAVIAIESAELVNRLKEQREFQERLISSSPDGIIAIDRQGLVTELNQQAAKVLGYTREEVLGEPVTLLYFDAKEPLRIGRMLHESADDEVSGYETAVRSKAGERIPIRHASTWLFNAEGERVGSVGYFEDLRERKALERRESLLLRASNVVAREEVLDKGLQRLAEMMVELLRRSFCCILIMEEDGDCLVLRAASRSDELQWTPGRQRIDPKEWQGLPELLEKGIPTTREWRNPNARPSLERLARALGLDPEEEIRSLLIVPLKIGDRVVGQLDLGDLRQDAKAAFPSQEIELVSAIAAQITVLVDRMELLEKRTRLFNQLAILHRISDYIQAADKLEWILLTVLTGVTASFGLGFNRAMLMLIDETGEQLVGEMGVGELEERKARAVWEKDEKRGANSFEHFRRMLENHEIGPRTTTVGKKISGLRIPAQGDHLFAEVLSAKDFRRIEIEELTRVPQEFLATFGVTTPLAVVPLMVKGQVIGILAVDNKFNQTPISDESCNQLMTFAATAAVAIDNRRLFDQNRSAANKLLDFYKMSEELIALQEPRQILRKVVEQTKAAAGASWVSVILIDEAGRAFVPIKTGHRFSLEPMDSLPIRPEGLSMEVMRTGEACRIENVDKVRHRINRDLMSPSVRAAICLPLSLPGKRIGVMWIHYEEPRRFPDSEVAALLLYVTQAAIAYDSARRLERVEDLREFSDALADADDMKSVLRQIVEDARQVLKADTAVLWVYDEPAESFIPEVSVHAGDHLAAWIDLQRKGPRLQGTALRVMTEGWLLVDDVQDPSRESVLGPNTREFVDAVGGRGFLGVTLKTGRERLGVLYAIYAKPFQFDDQERDKTLSFANRASLFLKKSKLFHQVQRAQGAAELVASLILREDQKGTLKSIAREIREALDCGVVVLYQYDQELGDLVLPPAMAGVEPDAKYKSNYQRVLAIVERDEPKIVQDVSEDELFKDSSFARLHKIKSFVAFPLKAADRKVGVMFVNYRNPRRFTKDDVTTMALFANQAAVGIRNAQLFGELASKLAEQGTLAGLSKELLGVSSVQETMDRAVEYAARTLDTQLSNIVLPDREGRLLFSAAVGQEQKELVGKLVLEPGKGSQTGYTIQERMPVKVYDYRKETRFSVPSVVFDHKIHSGLSVPMFREGEIVGAMLVHTRKPRRFNQDDETLLSLIANQTAIALERARQYEASQRKSLYLTALYEVSKAITAQFALERRQILEQILQPAMRIVGLQGPRATLGVIQLYDEYRDELVLESVYPPENYQVFVEQFGERRPLRSRIARGEKIGISGQTVIDGEPQLIPDVRKNDEYIEFASATLSQLTVPLIDRDLGKVIGVLSVESDQTNAFDKEDQEALQTLAELAVIAIQNARRIEEVRTQTTLAWMGLGNAVGRHELAGEIGTLQARVYLIEQALEADRPLLQRARELLSEIVDQLKSLGLDRLPQDHESRSSLRVNEDLVSAFHESFVESHPGWRQRCTTFFELDPEAQIHVNQDWLFRVLDVLVHNARQAGARNIVLGTRSGQQDLWAEVYVADDGKGIPEGVRGRLLHEPIREGSKGLGTGLLIAQEVVRKYGGAIRFEDRKPKGTVMVLSLPVERPSSSNGGEPVQ